MTHSSQSCYWSTRILTFWIWIFQIIAIIFIISQGNFYKTIVAWVPLIFSDVSPSCVQCLNKAQLIFCQKIYQKLAITSSFFVYFCRMPAIRPAIVSLPICFNSMLVNPCSRCKVGGAGKIRPWVSPARDCISLSFDASCEIKTFWNWIVYNLVKRKQKDPSRWLVQIYRKPHIYWWIFVRKKL